MARCPPAPPGQRDLFLPPYAEKGCWARLYEQAGFDGRMRQLEGPVYAEAVGSSPVIVPDLGSIPPQPLFEEVRSVVVGPHARLQGYGEALFRGAALALAPDSREADIDFGARIKSFTLQCEA